ncbi:unnamed protein product [Heterobilharzia americana]|nr:unnamed protein product [Heterobilharzia americana]
MILLIVVEWIMQRTMRSEKMGKRCLTDKKTLEEELDFTDDDLYLVYYVAQARKSTGENLQIDSRGSENKTSSECREDEGDQNTQPTTRGTNHNPWEKPKGSCLFHLPNVDSIVSTSGGTGTHEDVKTNHNRKDSNTDLPSSI